MNTNICPKTWMAESILVTIFCCLPFGIVGIINASKVSSLYAQGNYDEAQRASADAKKWTLIGLCVGFVGIIAYLAVYGFAAFTLLNVQWEKKVFGQQALFWSDWYTFHSILQGMPYFPNAHFSFWPDWNVLVAVHKGQYTVYYTWTMQKHLDIMHY